MLVQTCRPRVVAGNREDRSLLLERTVGNRAHEVMVIKIYSDHEVRKAQDWSAPKGRSRSLGLRQSIAQTSPTVALELMQSALQIKTPLKCE